MTYTQFKSLRSIDLDQDGVAELMQEWEYSKGGRTSQLFTVYRMNGKTLQELLTQPVGYNNSAEYGEDEQDRILICEGTAALTDNLELLIDVKLKHGKSMGTEYNCKLGRHLFRMKNGNLVEVTKGY